MHTLHKKRKENEFTDIILHLDGIVLSGLVYMRFALYLRFILRLLYNPFALYDIAKMDAWIVCS